MKKYRKTKKVTVEGLQLKKRVGRNRGRAKFVGTILLLATIALTVAVAILPMLSGTPVALKATSFWKAFKGMDVKSAEGFTKVVVAGLYGFMLFVLLINVLRSLGKIKKLGKKKGTKTDGFNHSAYAMHDLGKLFSGSFVQILFTYFLINLICKDAKPEGMWLVIVLGAAAVIHLFTGVLGGKISYFDIEDGKVVEQRREVGRFAPFFRNVLQLGAVFAIMYFMLAANAKSTILAQFVTLSVGSVFGGLGMGQLLVSVAQLVAVFCLFILAKHATGITEYNIDGAHGSGMKNFRVFSFFVFLTAGAAVACKFLLTDKTFDLNWTIVAAVAFVMFIIECIMRKMPKIPGEAKAKKEKANSDEHITLDDMSANFVDQPVTKEDKKSKKNKKEKGKDAQAQSAAVNQPMYPTPAPMPAPAPAPAPHYVVHGQSYPTQQPAPTPYPYAPYYPYYPVAMPPMQAPQAPQAPQAQTAPAVHILPIVNLQAENQAAATSAAATTPAPVAPAQAPAVEQTPVEEQEEREAGPRVEVNCPLCGKRLRVNSGAKYHRCPACERVFAIRGKESK